MKISIVIPNFNGGILLQKNLPNILDSGADEVFIIDDGSSDKSWEFLSELQSTNDKLQIFQHQVNKGFIPTVNELFKKAVGDIVVLLNNDVWVDKDFLKPLLKHFEDSNVFAVNLHEEGEGPAIAFWKDGFFEFNRGEERGIVQKSSWASGGSAAFRKSIWEELGGFDNLFAPFYWEDIDLSFRALKAGYDILWEPGAKVNHEHGTIIKKSHNKKYTQLVQQRNQLLFIWKNIKDKNLIKEHKRFLLKRLLTSGLGYWIVYVWALIRLLLPRLARDRNDVRKFERSDMEAINYAQSPTISVIVVSYSSENFIEKCISSVLENLPKSGEVIVLDNNSTDKTVDILEKFENKIKLIKSKENLGFSKGNNRASKEATGDYLFFLNPDTEIETSLDPLVAFYENTTDAGIVAPKLIMPSGEIQESVKKLPTIIGAFKEYILRAKKAYSQYVPDTDEPVSVEMVYGAAWLIKKELFRELGGFNEKFFMYYEDADFCKRLGRLGKKVYYYPGVSIKHLVGATRTDKDKYKLNLESSKKYHGLIGIFFLRLIFFISRLLKKV